MNFSLYSKKLIGITSCWGILGFYRGTQEYNFHHSNDINDYNKQMIYHKEQIEKDKKYKIEHPTYNSNYVHIPPVKPTYFYLSSITNGFFGSALYIFPCTTPICVMKEIYRIEINLRNLDEEKKKKFYNTLFN